MTAPDPIAARAYRLVVDSAEKDAARALREVHRNVDAIDDADAKDRVSALGAAQRLAVDVAELIRHLSALRSLHEVEFLATGLEEKTDG